MTSEEVDSISAIKSEIIALTANLKIEQRQRNEYKLIKDAVFDCANLKGALNPELQSKVLDIVMNDEISESTELNNKYSLLNTKSFEFPIVTYEEKQYLKSAVEASIKKKRHTVFEELKEVGIKLDDVKSKHSTQDEFDVEYQVLLESKNSLNENQKMYLKYLNELIDIYEQIIKLQVNTMPTIINERVKILEANICNLKLKANILDASVKVEIFTETPQSLNAYNEIFKHIYDEQQKCDEEIKKLQVLKEKYNQVSSKQYNEILKNYLHYKNRIDNMSDLRK